MIFNLNYVMYIVYSFLVLFSIYMCVLLYKKYSYIVFKSNEKIILSEKYSEENNIKNKTSPSNTSNKIKNIKKHFKIKSTENTYEDIKFVSKKPNYININTNSNNLNLQNIYDLKKIKNYKDDILTQKIANTYINTKQQFYNIFVNTENDKKFIGDLDDFCLFHKNNSNIPESIKINILLKFYNKNTNKDKYIYIFVNRYNMIKITRNYEYNNLCEMIEKNNGIFILNDDNIKDKYFVGYGNYTESKTNPENIKKIFFPNTENCQTNKNYILFSEFEFIKIYFYVCNEI